MEIKQAFVNGRLMDVVSQEEYTRRASLGNKDMLANTCIQSDGTLYPVVSRSNGAVTPHAISMGPVTKYVGSSKEYPAFSDKAVIDFTAVSSNKELIEKQNMARKEEVNVLTQSGGKTFAPVIRDEDSPALKVVKTCLHDKNIDIDNYRGRFDSNCDFSNTIRLLTNPDNHNISVQKIHLIGEKFDIEFHLSAKDKPGAINPMNTSTEMEI